MPQLTKLPLIRWLLNTIPGIPGPLLAKLRIGSLWKLAHFLRGTYRDAIARLHAKSGSVVQIGPDEISVANKKLLYIPELTPLADPVDAAAQKDLESNLHMSNIFTKETEIDSCNQKLLTLLSIAGKKGENINLRTLLTHYAYETMIITTTDIDAGFLEPAQDTSKTDAVLSNWKFYSVLYGTYLRYHPFIASVLKLFGIHDKTAAEALKNTTGVEARIALSLAGADPTIILLFNAIQHVYANPVLLERLRSEIAEFRATHAPTFKELILNKGHMPLLHAVLLECVRLQLPSLTGPRYTAGESFTVGDQPIAPGTKITLEPSITHADPNIFGSEPFSFKPERWLDSDHVQKMKFSLLAFNASTATAIEAFQILLASKFLTTLVPDFDLAASPTKNGHFYVLNEKEKRLDVNNTQADASTIDNSSQTPTSSSEGSTAKVHAGSRGNRTPVTLSHADRLISILGNEDAEEILNGRFAPHLTHFPKQPIFTKRLESSRDRALVHEAIGAIYDKRLYHVTHHENQNLAIGPPGSIPREYTQRPWHRSQPQQNGRYNNNGNGNGNRNNQRRPTAAPRTRPPQQPQADKPDAGWGSFAKTEEQRQLHFKTTEGYREKLEAIAKEAKENPAPKPEPATYVTLFKQTNGKTVKNKLGGARIACATETFDSHGNVSRTEHIPPPTKAEIEQPEKVTSVPGFVPPHVRKQREREQAEKKAQEQTQQ